MMTLFNGLSAFPITPADQHGRVDTDGLCRMLERFIQADVQSVGLLGSTGTYMFLSRSQRQRAIEAAAECLGGKLPLIAGVGAIRTDEVQALVRDAARCGADGLLLAPVSYTPLTDEEVYQHYAGVAEISSLPLCIYNNPGTTNFSFSSDLLARLSLVQTISAVKMPLPGERDLEADIAHLRGALSDDFQVGYSGDWGCAEAMLAGADCWFSVVAGILPVPTLKLCNAAKAGERSEAERINAKFQPLWDLFQQFGSLRVVYAIANQLSLSDAQPPRPLLPLSSDDQERVEAALEGLNGLG
jgi:4-hydroxy-tetrahydrodipicolinate synthase